MYQKLTLAALTLLVSGAAIAGNLYRDLDANEDGAISQEEAAASPTVSDQWTTLDTNADGQLDQAEFAKMEVTEEKAPAAK